MTSTAIGQTNIELARQCLALIRDIAERGASSSDPDQIGYAIQELSQVLLERLGSDAIAFMPVSAAQLTDLPHLHDELLFIDGISREIFQSA
jgi:hypothetical protein